MEALETKHYPGVGNDMHKLQHTIDSLESTAAMRHEEDKMMGLTKTAMLKAIQLLGDAQVWSHMVRQVGYPEW